MDRQNLTEGSHRLRQCLAEDVQGLTVDVGITDSAADKDLYACSVLTSCQVLPNLGRIQQELWQRVHVDPQRRGSISVWTRSGGFITYEMYRRSDGTLVFLGPTIESGRTRNIDPQSLGWGQAQPVHMPAADESEDESGTVEKFTRCIEFLRDSTMEVVREGTSKRPAKLLQVLRQRGFPNAQVRAIGDWFRSFTSQGDRPHEEVVLEAFEGFVEEIDGDTAYVTLTSEHGDRLAGRYSASALLEKGISERRRFTCRTVQLRDEVRVVIEPIPERHLSEAEEAAIYSRIDRIFPDDAFSEQ